MALAIDASTPAYNQGTGTISLIQSNSFSPPAGSLILMICAWPAVATPTPSANHALAWNQLALVTGNSNASLVIYAADCPIAQTGLVVTTTWSVAATTGANAAIAAIVMTGTDLAANQGATQTGVGTGTTAAALSLATTVKNSWVFGSFHVSTPVGPTFGTGITDSFNGNTFDLSGPDDSNWVGRTNSTTPSAGTNVSINSTAPTQKWVGAVVEIVSPADLSINVTSSVSASTSATATVITGSLNINSTTPAYKQGAGTNISSLTSATFSPLANTLLLVFCTWGANANPSIIDSLTPDLTWNVVGLNQQAGASTVIYAADCPLAQTSMTVTVSWDAVTPTGADVGLGVIVMTAASGAASQPGASGSVFGTSPVSMPVTTTANSSWVMGVFRELSTTVPTFNANQVDTFGGLTQLATGTAATSWLQRTTAKTTNSGTVVTLGTSAPTGASYIGTAIEVLPAVGVADRNLPLLSDSTATSELVVVGYPPVITDALTVDIVEPVATSEALTQSIRSFVKVSDSGNTAEFAIVAIPGVVGDRFAQALDSTTTADNATVVKSSLSDLTVTTSDPTSTSEGLGIVGPVIYSPVNTTDSITIQVQDSGLSARNIPATDSSSTSESVAAVIIGPLNVVVSDPTSTSEFLVVIGPVNIPVLDATTTADHTDVVIGGARLVPVSDSARMSERATVVVPSIGVTSLGLDSRQSVQMTIARMDAGSLTQNGRLDAGHFGLNSLSLLYFDTSGATSGEAAALGYDGAVGFFVAAGRTDADLQHLMVIFIGGRITAPLVGPPQAAPPQPGPVIGVPAMPPQAVAALNEFP